MFKSIFSKYQIDSILRIWDNAPKNIPYYIGTTLLNLNRASAAQTLTGVSISGNAGTVTNGFYNTSSFNLGTTSIPINRASATQTLTGVNIDGNAITAGTAGTVLNTNLGATAIGISTFTTAADWSKPAGYQTYLLHTSISMPPNCSGTNRMFGDWFAYNVIGKRDVNGGTYATLTSQNGSMWFTYMDTSSTLPTWTKVQTNVNTSATYSGGTSATTSTSSGLITFSTVPTFGNSTTYTITNSYFGNSTIAQAAIIDFSIKYLSSPTNTGLIIAGYFIDSSGIINVRVYNIGTTNPASFQLCYNVIG
jgi:hypothetical protein